MLDRLLNYIFGFILILMYVVFAGTDEQTRIIIAFFLAAVMAFYALLMNWLSLDGAFAAMITGTITLGLGGVSAAAVLLLYFGSSYFISFILDKGRAEHIRIRERRDGRQVWANAFWFVLFLVLSFYYQKDILHVAAVGALAVAIADTWATEIGMRAKNVRTWFILNFKRVDAGIDGGVSFPGTLGGLLGSFLLSIFFVLISGHHSILLFGIIGLAGFAGCILDSWLGALFQTRKKELRLPGELSALKHPDNNLVNAASTALGPVVILLLLWLI